MENTVRIPKHPLENTFGFKEIQTSQVLEAWGAIQICDFWTYLDFVTYPSAKRARDVLKT